jgi:hypothetical protein
MQDITAVFDDVGVMTFEYLDRHHCGLHWVHSVIVSSFYAPSVMVFSRRVWGVIHGTKTSHFLSW